MLGEQVPIKIKHKLYAMLGDGIYPSRSGIIGRMITEIDHFSSIIEIHVTYKSFKEARLALRQKNFSLARKKGLSCWRGLMALDNSDFFMGERVCFDWLSLYALFFEIADCLRQVYAQEKHSISGWFCDYLLKVARNVEVPFLFAKWHAFYVEYLQHSNKLTEALAGSLCLKRFIENEFGEDYADWLEDAPNAVELYQRLENVSPRKSPGPE